MKNQSQWRNISIRDYYDIKNILQSDLDLLTKQVEVIGIINGLSSEEILRMPLEEYNKLNKDIEFLQDFPLNKNSKPPKSIKINDQVYNIDTDFTDFTVAQYIDFQNYWALDDVEQYYGNILACFIIPEKHQYGEGYNVSELAQLIYDNIDILTANEIVFFSLRKSVILIENLMAYLNHLGMTKKMTSQEKEKVLQMRNRFLDGLTILKSTLT